MRPALLLEARTRTSNVSAEKRLRGGRLFYDSATTLGYLFLPN